MSSFSISSGLAQSEMKTKGQKDRMPGKHHKVIAKDKHNTKKEQNDLGFVKKEKRVAKKFSKR